MNVAEYLPTVVNEGPLLTAYTLNKLKKLVKEKTVILPVCSLGTELSELAEYGDLVLPPLYHEAMDDELKSQILARVQQCFPFYEDTRDCAEFEVDFRIVDLPSKPLPDKKSPRILAFSVDTAVEEHGPHIPLMTDTIQSYGVLQRLEQEIGGFFAGPPVEYGQLTWGLPFGLSIDITAPLLTRYVTGFTNAVLDWLKPRSLYVVDVHGSIVHRNAIQDGLRQSRCENWRFRWLHEPLVEFAGDRGDQHAGGVETSLVHHISNDLVDASWWPDRIDELADKQMSMSVAIDLSSDLSEFIQQVETESMNGIVGDVRNFYEVDADVMMNRMLGLAREDVGSL